LTSSRIPPSLSENFDQSCRFFFDRLRIERREHPRLEVGDLARLVR